MPLFRGIRRYLLSSHTSQSSRRTDKRPMRFGGLEQLEARLALAITVHGTIDFVTPDTTSASAVMPLREALVQVGYWLTVQGEETYAFEPARTDYQGAYSAVIPDGAHNVKVRVFLENPHDDDTPKAWYIQEDLPGPLNLDVFTDVRDLSAPINGATYSADYHAAANTRESQAFAVFNWLVEAQHYAESVGLFDFVTTNPEFVSQRIVINSTADNTKIGQTFLNPADVSTTPLHEFGHFVLLNNKLDVSPGGRHSPMYNARGVAWAWYDLVTQAPSYRDLALAWAEGSADAFAARVQEVRGIAAQTPLMNYYDIETPSPNTKSNASVGYVGLGEDSEVSIARIIWDLADSGPSDDDEVAMTDEALATLLKTRFPNHLFERHITSLRDLWSVLYSKSSSDFDDNLSYGEIFSQNGVGVRAIAATPTPDMANVNFTFDIPYTRRLPLNGTFTETAGIPLGPSMTQFTIRAFYEGRQIFSSGPLSEGSVGLALAPVNLPESNNQVPVQRATYTHSLVGVWKELGSWNPEDVIWLVESNYGDLTVNQPSGYWSNNLPLFSQVGDFDVKVDSIARTSATEAQVTYTILGRAAGAFNLTVGQVVDAFGVYVSGATTSVSSTSNLAPGQHSITVAIPTSAQSTSVRLGAQIAGAGLTGELSNANNLVSASGVFVEAVFGENYTDQLVITGTPGADTVDVVYVPLGSTYNGIAGESYVVTLNGTQTIVPARRYDVYPYTYQSFIRVMVVDMGDGDDVVDLAAVSSVMATVKGGAGDDSIVGTSCVIGYWSPGDFLYGGSGSDYLFGGDGDDSLWAGDGPIGVGTYATWYWPEDDDALVGGAGNDTLICDTGSASLDGGNGSDSYTIPLSSVAGEISVADSGTAGTDTLSISGTDESDSIVAASGEITIDDTTVTYSSAVETVSISGGAGNDHAQVVGAVPANLSFASVAPAVQWDANTAVTGSEGSQVSLAGHVVDFYNNTSFIGRPQLSVDWGDGTTSTPAIQWSGLNGIITATHTYADDGVYQPAVKAAYYFGLTLQEFETSTSIVAIQDVPTSLTFTGPSSGLRGNTLTYSVGVSDVSDGDEAAGFGLFIDWGDGTTPLNTETSAGTSNVNHQYAASGTYNVQVSVQDKSLNWTTTTKTVTIAGISTGGFRTDLANPQQTLLDYTLSAAVSALTIKLYASANGSTLDDQLSSYTITNTSLLSVGTHTVALPANFVMPQDNDLLVYDHLVAKFDSAVLGNEQALFSGGAILASNGSLYLLGTETADLFSLNFSGTTQVRVKFGQLYSAFMPVASIARIESALYGGDDLLSLTNSGPFNVSATGGAGADQLVTSAGADKLSGDDGDDFLISDGGIDWLRGGLGSDNLNSGGLADTVYVDYSDVVIDGLGIDHLDGYVPGDANHDHYVDGLDYVAWADHFGQDGGWLHGDFNHDGHVDGLDYIAWADHFNPHGVALAKASAGEFYADFAPSLLQSSLMNVYWGGTEGDDEVSFTQLDATTVVMHISKLNGVAVTLEDRTFTDVTGEIVAYGLTGNDMIDGSGLTSLRLNASGDEGDDTLISGGGDDTLAGGTGSDSYVFAGNAPLGSDTIDDTKEPDPESNGNELNFMKLTPGAANLGIQLDLGITSAQTVLANVLSLTLSNDSFVSMVVGTRGNDMITGGGEDAVTAYLGGPGDDLITGGASGNDTFIYLNLDGVEGFDIGSNHPSGGHVSQGYDTIFATGPGEGTFFFGDAGGMPAFPANVNLDLRTAKDGIGQEVANNGEFTNYLSLAVHGVANIRTVFGSQFGNTIYANEMGANLLGGNGPVHLIGGDGADLLVADVAVLGVGTLQQGAGAILEGRGGNDILVGGTGDDILDGGDGNDLILSNPFMIGGSTGSWSQGNDTLIGGDGDDMLVGGNGNDFLNGGGGADTLISSSYQVNGTSDPLGDGNDILEGGFGDDFLIAGNGNNVFSFARTDATVNLGTDYIGHLEPSGESTLDFSDYGAAINLNLGYPAFADAGHLLLWNIDIAQNATVALGLYNSHVIGSAFADIITGDSGDNILEGGGGDDQLNGGAGRDILIGGAGADILDGGGGEDLLIAGEVEFGAARAVALRAIQAEWLYATRLYADRVANLVHPANTGGLNGSYHLEPGSTALDDGVIDHLYGGDDLDWFLYADALDDDVVEDGPEEIDEVNEVLTDLLT